MITVIGMDGSPLGPEAAKAVASASLVVGGRRHLAAVADSGAGPAAAGSGAGRAAAHSRARAVVLGPLAPALDTLADHDGDAVVLASGDPGFFGIVRALRERGLAPAVLPARSSVSLAFARAGLPWDDAVVVSAHGRDLRRAVNLCRAHPKVAVLTGPGAGPAELAAELAGWDRRLLVCERLGAEGERITECAPADAGRAWEDPNVVLVLAAAPAAARAPGAGPDSAAEAGLAPGLPAPDATPGWIWPPAGWHECAAAVVRATPTAHSRGSASEGWALPEEEFDSGGAVITKSEVRALALARLGPRPGMLVWDVGAGAGSVAVECARFGAAVVAVERDPGRCGLTRANARRHGVDVRVVTGEAPAALAGLPPPDAVFVGGGGPDVVAAAAARRPARIVVALAAVERVGPARAALAEAGYRVEGAMVQAARLAPLPGEVHRLAAMNPVMLLWTAGRPAWPAAAGQRPGPVDGSTR